MVKARKLYPGAIKHNGYDKDAPVLSFNWMNNLSNRRVQQRDKPHRVSYATKNVICSVLICSRQPIKRNCSNGYIQPFAQVYSYQSIRKNI